MSVYPSSAFWYLFHKVHHIQVGGGGQLLAGVEDLVHIIGGEIHPVGVFLSLDANRDIEDPDPGACFVLRGEIAGGIGQQ